MRKRANEKHFFFSDDELKGLKNNAKKAGLSESALVRQLVCGFAPREKPDEQFYAAMREMSAIGNNLNQIARKAAILGFIDAPYYKKEAEKWNAFRLDVKRKFLEPEKWESNDRRIE